MANQSEFYEQVAKTEAGYAILFLTVCCAFLLCSQLKLPLLSWQRARNKLQSLSGKVFWLSVGVLYFGFRLVLMPSSFWYDETFTGVLARLPIDRMFGAVIADVHPPLPYLMFWFTGRIFGTSELALRLPSLALGLVAVYLIYLITKEIFNSETTARVAAVIVCILPGHIYYSTEARGYMLLAVMVLASIQASKTNRPLLFAIAAAPLGWIHAHGFIYLFVLIIIQAKRYLSSLQWRIALMGAGLVSAAWLPMMLQQSQDVADGFWLYPLSPGGFLWPLADLTVGFRLANAFLLLTSVSVVMLVTIASVWRYRRYVLTHKEWLAVGVGVPVMIAVISVVWRPVYLSRALLPAVLLLVPLWARLLTHLQYGLMYRLLLIPVLLIGSINIQLPDEARKDLRGAFSLCDDLPIYAMSSSVGIMALYYGHNVTIRPGADDLNQSISTSGKAAFGLTEDDIENGRGLVCVVRQENALTEEAEQDYINRVYQYPVLYKSTPIDLTGWRVQIFLVNRYVRPVLRN